MLEHSWIYARRNQLKRAQGHILVFELCLAHAQFLGLYSGRVNRTNTNNKPSAHHHFVNHHVELELCNYDFKLSKYNLELSKYNFELSNQHFELSNQHFKPSTPHFDHVNRAQRNIVEPGPHIGDHISCIAQILQIHIRGRNRRHRYRSHSRDRAPGRRPVLLPQAAERSQGRRLSSRAAESSRAGTKAPWTGVFGGAAVRTTQHAAGPGA